MSVPPNVRVNIGAPFPSVVKALAPFTISKVSGIWTIGLSFLGLGVQAPTIPQAQTDFLLVWDSIAKTFFTIPMSSVVGNAGGAVQRSITSGPVVITGNDRTLNLNLTSSLTINLPGYLSRLGVSLTFKDVGMQATAHPITIAAAAGETIDVVNTSISLNTNGQSITLIPANDTVNTGWFRE